MRRSICFFVLVGLFLFSCRPDQQPFAPGTTATRYYAVFLNGAKIGHAVHTRSTGPGRVTTRMEMNLSVNREGTVIENQTVDIIWETPQGRPLGFDFKTGEKRNNRPFQRFTGDISENRLKIKTMSSASEAEKKWVWPDGRILGTGVGFENRMALEGLEKDTAYTIQAFMPSQLAVATVDIRIGGRHTMRILGKTRELIEVNMTSRLSSGQTVTATEYRDDNLQAYKTVVPFGQMTMELVACTRQEAFAENSHRNIYDTFDLKSPEDLSTLIRQPAVQYHIVPQTADTSLSIPDIAGQKVIPDKSRGWQVIVSRQDIPRRTQRVIGSESRDIREALAATPYLQKDDPRIAGLTREALQGETDPGTAAGMIEAFVHAYITEKNYATGYATASEVAERRQGDFTEHALLAAAMFRNAGIPAKIVFGFVYADDESNPNRSFRLHAWNAVYIGGRWYGLDATGVNGGYGPGHIALSAGDGSPATMAALIHFSGNLEIKAVRSLP